MTPIGVAEFTTSLPAELAQSLPSVQQIEAELTRHEYGEMDVQEPEES